MNTRNFTLSGYKFIVILLSVFCSTATICQVQMPDNRGAAAREATSTIRLNIKDFGAKGDGRANDLPPFEAAKNELQKRGGGTIYFPAGKYMATGDAGWRVFASNIRLEGDGMDKTFLLTPDGSKAAGLLLSPYRDAGWNNAPEQQYAYEDNVKEGDMHIALKPGQDMSAFMPGTIFFLSAGASYYDQYFGEFNIVDKVSGTTLYLRYPIGKNYAQKESAWYGILQEPFTPPAIHQTAVATVFRGPQKLKSPIAISFGNELYKVTAINGSQLTVENMGKGNSNAVLPKGTRVYKARSIRLAPSASYQVTVENMTIVGHPKAVVVSNSVKTRFNNVKFISSPGIKPGSIWLDGDGGRDCIISNCIAQSDSIIPSQFARSFCDIKVLHSTFMQTSIDFTEFNANCEVANCTFTMKSPNGSNKYLNNPAITVGASTYNSYIHDNIINVYRRSAAIASQPDIQTYPRNRLNKTLIEHNTIQAELCSSAISVAMLGDIRITSNIITGSVPFLFGRTSPLLYADQSLTKEEQQQLISQSICRITNNTFEGYTDDFYSRGTNNVIIEGNTVKNLGDYTKGGNKLALLGGNIVPGSVGDDTIPVSLFVLKNNTFIGWNYTKNSINFNKPVNKNVDISNNKFIDNIGSFRKEKAFTVSYGEK